MEELDDSEIEAEAGLVYSRVCVVLGLSALYGLKQGE
jgi:hypothetical protein